MTIDIENKEWPEDGKLPELVGKANPFAVPDGYFEGLDERIMAAVKMDELKSNMPDAGFTMPGDYFEQLAGNIQARITVEEMVNGRDAGFAVPAGYFENLSDNIQSRIAVEEAMEAGEGFEVPAGYFENLSSQIQSRVFVEETLSADETFTVPDGYFEQLNAKILNKTVTQEVVQRKVGVVRLMRSTAFKYATAACFLLVAGASFMLWPSATSIEAHDASYLHKELSNIPKDELQGYIEVSMDGSDVQHTVVVEELPVKDAAFNPELQDYIEQ
ncbi:hypothetical protein ACFQZS_14940 [Mucilaginibacter calamicampi]|uniref:Uncharacterized protein n=1 Tax=Mucilaginibacter calamicampi TaxID=1302352 RepID=A0ABW2Z406_9SPHI